MSLTTLNPGSLFASRWEVQWAVHAIYRSEAVTLLEKAMFTALQHAYAKLGDDELLQLASDRSSLF
jgi:hypothetical protein